MKPEKLLDENVTFLTLVAQRSFRRAAEVLHTKPSDVSLALLRLERRVGTRLIERGDSIRITDAGYQYAARLASADLQDAMKAYRRTRRGP